MQPRAEFARAMRATGPWERSSSSLGDAIPTMDLSGVITSWNWGAQRLFGYAAEETIGKPVTLLIPADLHNEEPAILDRIRRGERVEHYDTIGQRKDGTHIDISLTISPLRDPEGKIIGASKIARDITRRRRAEEQQRLLLREMDHRVKNLFALASGVVGLSARSDDQRRTVVGGERHAGWRRRPPSPSGRSPQATRQRRIRRRCVRRRDHPLAP